MMTQQGMPPQITPQMIQQFLMAQQPPRPMAQGAPPMQGMPPQGQPPQAPPSQANMPPPMAGGQMNPNIAAFMQAQQGQRPGQPPMQQQQPGGQPQQGAPQGPPMSPQMQAMMMQRQKMMQDQQMAQQLASQGRNGDTTVAHMTPGEIAVPPEVQSPKVLSALKKEFDKHGVPLSHAQVGNPASSVNPATGVHEYNFMSMFLPAAMGIAGAALAPMTGGASLGLSDLAMGAIGGGLGSTAGGLLAGESPMQAGLTGLGSAVGGYGLGSLGSSAGSAAAGAAGIAPGAASSGASALADASAGFPGYTAGAAGNAPFMGSQMLGNAIGNFNPLSAAGSAAGGALGSALGAPTKATGPQLPAGFNTPLAAKSTLPSFQNQLGYNTYNGPTPNFNNYNPQTNNPGAWNFYGT